MITNKKINLKENGDAANVILTSSSITITDATLMVSDVKLSDVCVKGNDCNPNAVMAAGKSKGLTVKRVGSSVAYDMVHYGLVEPVAAISASCLMTCVTVSADQVTMTCCLASSGGK